MRTALNILQYADVVAFLGLAYVTFSQWRTRSDESSMWAFMTFGLLASIAVLGLVLPDDPPQTTFWTWTIKLVVAVLLLFPYFLFRISSAFRKEPSWFDRVAVAVTAGIILWTLLLPSFPGEGDPRPDWFQYYITGLLLQWVALSVVVAVRFWRAGQGQPAVARKRMRMLSLASVVLSVGIVISGQTGGAERSDASELMTQLITTFSVVAFFIAFAPPTWLRIAWRRPVEESLRRGTLNLMASETSEDVMEVLLPHALGIIGGEGIAVLDSNGKVIGSRGMDPAAIARAGDLPLADDPHERDAATGLVHLEFPFGALVVQTGPYTPFFGQDEIDLLGSLGALANLALERVAAGDLRLQLEKAGLRRQQALEINDNIVQGLAVAKYSFDLKQHDKAREAIEGTLVAARSIISELLDDVGGEVDFGPGALTRGHAATGFMSSDLTKQREAQEKLDSN